MTLGWLATRVFSLVLVAVVAGCWWQRTLSLTVINDGPEPVTVEMVIGDGRAAEPELSVVVQPGDTEDVQGGRGGGRWTVLVDGNAVTASEEWPFDNPIIELTIHVAPDGSVEVIDT